MNSVQTFIGFANSRYIFSSVNGFLNYVANDSNYVECSNGSSSLTGACPGGTSITGPVLLYLQQAGVNRSVRDAGTQSIPQTELDFYIQDTWKPNSNWTFNYGLRWSAQLEPSILSPKDSTAYHSLYGTTVTNAKGTFAFPSDGTIPSDKKMIQPRLGIAWDPHGDGRQVWRASAGLYYARIPGLNLASTRSTDGYRGVTLFGSSGTIPFGLPAPSFPNLFPGVVQKAKDVCCHHHLFADLFGRDIPCKAMQVNCQTQALDKTSQILLSDDSGNHAGKDISCPARSHSGIAGDIDVNR